LIYLIKRVLRKNDRGFLLYNSIFELKNDCGGCSVTPAPSLTLDNCMVISGEKREYEECPVLYYITAFLSSKTIVEGVALPQLPPSPSTIVWSYQERKESIIPRSMTQMKHN